MSTTQTLITAIIGVLTVAGAYLAARLQRPKIEAEAQQIIGQTYAHLIDNLRTDIKSIKQELAYERKRNYALEGWAKAMSAQLVEHGHNPPPYADFKQRYFGEHK